MTVVLPWIQHHLGNKYFNAILMHHRTSKPQRQVELELLQFPSTINPRGLHGLESPATSRSIISLSLTDLFSFCHRKNVSAQHTVTPNTFCCSQARPALFFKLDQDGTTRHVVMNFLPASPVWRSSWSRLTLPFKLLKSFLDACFH